MHTYFSASAGFIFNADFSGNVRITSNDKSVCFPMSELLDFVAHEYVSQRKIEAIENMSRDELFGIKKENQG